MCVGELDQVSSYMYNANKQVCRNNKVTMKCYSVIFRYIYSHPLNWYHSVSLSFLQKFKMYFNSYIHQPLLTFTCFPPLYNSYHFSVFHRFYMYLHTCAYFSIDKWFPICTSSAAYVFPLFCALLSF